MRLDDLEKRVEELIAQAKTALANVHRGDFGPYVTSENFAALRAASLSFIERVFGRDHPHYREFDKSVEDVSDHYVQRGLGILTAIRDEIRGGWLFTTRGLVSAEVFADFLEMADYLLQEGYKDAAAVLVGGVLEEHLRQLAQKHGVPVQDGAGRARKADTINAELKKAGVYNALDQKTVTSWLDLRNKAAHGNYSEYGKDQVELLLAGVRAFIARIPL